MKKKIVNLVLSAAVITSMMFAVTACGSKDDASSGTSAANTTVEDTATPAPTTAAEPEEEKQDEEEGMSLQDWLDQGTNSADMDSVVTELSTDELGVSYKADGDTFVLVYTFSDVVEIDDEGKASMESEFKAQSAVFENMRDALIEETGNQNIKIRMEYINGDGSEIFSYEF